jgi:hypothetical protein
MTFTSTTIRKLQALGLPPDMFDAVLQIMEEAREVKKKGNVADRKVRGSRLSAEWTLPRAWGEYALSIGLHEQEVRREAERFRNYWHAASGANAIKLDWFATWKNWVLKTAEKLGREPRPGAFTGAEAAQGPASYTHETWERIVRIWKLTSNWHPDNGPAPGRVGCLVPKELLQ